MWFKRLFSDNTPVWRKLEVNNFIRHWSVMLLLLLLLFLFGFFFFCPFWSSTACAHIELFFSLFFLKCEDSVKTFLFVFCGNYMTVSK